MGVGKPVFEFVGVLPVGRDVDCHVARDACELACAGIRDDAYRKVWPSFGHDAGVVQRKTARFAGEGAGESFDGDVNTGRFRAADRQHLSF